MGIIDRYILRQFLKSFVICFFSLTGLYVVFDAFANLEEFRATADKSGGLLATMGPHYLYKSLLFFDQTRALLTLVAAMFTVAWFQRHNEMTALMAAGISRVRVVAPILVAAVVVSLLGVGNRELLMPRFRDEMARKPSDLLGDRPQEMSPRYDYETNIFFRGKQTFRDWQRIWRPDFLLPLELSEYGKQLAAENAYYWPPQADRPGGYLFEQVSQPENLARKPSLCWEGKPVIITPRDAPWLRPGQCFVVSNLTFEQLTGAQAFRSYSSTASLIAALRNPSLEFGADVRVAIHARIVQPVLDVTLLFLGLPLVLSRQSRNVFAAIGLCVGVVTVFLLLVIACQRLGAIYLLEPSLAAWLPLMIFAPIAVGLAEEMWR